MSNVAHGLTATLAPLRALWGSRSESERRGLTLAASALLLLVVWLLAVQPAWRTLREAPQRLDALDVQWLAMQRQAAESRELRAAVPVPPAQAAAALKAASERLGERARLVLQGERAVLTVTNASGEQLRGWLAEVRSGARARPLEVSLTRGSDGYSGTLVVGLAGPSP